MSADGQALEQLMVQVQRLTPDDQLRLIKQVAEMLIPVAQAKQSRRLIYGQFRGDNMSTDEDFLIAEWRPSEKELDGP